MEMSELVTVKQQLPPQTQNQELKETTVSKGLTANKTTMINGRLTPHRKLYVHTHKTGSDANL